MTGLISKSHAVIDVVLMVPSDRHVSEQCNLLSRHWPKCMLYGENYTIHAK